MSAPTIAIAASDGQTVTKAVVLPPRLRPTWESVVGTWAEQDQTWATITQTNTVLQRASEFDPITALSATEASSVVELVALDEE